MIHKFDNIIIIGTSHIAKESVKTVKKTIEDESPDIVAVELDYGRLSSLKSNQKRPGNITLLKNLGLSGYLFYLFGSYVQKSLGKVIKINPGEDMLTAVNVAEKNKINVLLIDRDIQITLRRFSKYFRKRELFSVIGDIVKGFFKKGELVKIDFSKVPEDKFIEMILEQAKDKYPSLYKILIDERDLYMAKNLFHIRRLNPDKKIVAVVGAGHIKGMLHYLNLMDKKID